MIKIPAQTLLARYFNGLLGVAPLAGAWIETNSSGVLRDRTNVAPLAGAWIETSDASPAALRPLVAPLAGAWIETPNSSTRKTAESMSRPSRARGLKHADIELEDIIKLVAPLAGAWIETANARRK